MSKLKRLPLAGLTIRAATMWKAVNGIRVDAGDELPAQRFENGANE